jgi:hypothetical protein
MQDRKSRMLCDVFPFSLLVTAGLWTDPAAPASLGAWIAFVGAHHSGALGFLIADVLMLTGVATLTGMQIMQVVHSC